VEPASTPMSAPMVGHAEEEPSAQYGGQFVGVERQKPQAVHSVVVQDVSSELASGKVDKPGTEQTPPLRCSCRYLFRLGGDTVPARPRRVIAAACSSLLRGQAYLRRSGLPAADRGDLSTDHEQRNCARIPAAGQHQKTTRQRNPHHSQSEYDNAYPRSRHGQQE
jgi:hypothetical protein